MGGILKLCDFGCAKILQSDQPNVFYSHAIDVWSGGCVRAELLMNRPIFRGSKSSDQMEKIMRVLSAPKADEIRTMFPEFRRELRTASSHSLAELLRSRPAEERDLELDFLQQVFQYK